MTTKVLQPSKMKLDTKYKVVFGLASFGINLIAGIYGALLPIFYQDYLGLSAKWISIASVVYAVWNAINDPLFGFITDNTRSDKGRRIPYMRYTAPFLGLTFVLVWFAPAGAGDIAIFWWMLVTMLLYDTCFTIIGLVYSALLPEVTESDAERNGLQISSSLFGMLGMIFGFIIPDMFRPKTGMEVSFWPLQIAMVVVAVVSVILILSTTIKVKERPEFYKVDEPIPFKDSLKMTFTSKSFLVLVAQNFMSILASSMILGTLFYVADYVLQINTMVLLVSLFIPLIIGVPITTLVREKVGVVGAQQIHLVIGGIGLVLVALVPKQLIPVCFALAGFGLAGPQTLTNVLFAQVADEDEIRSGVRREGSFFGVNALLTKPAQSIALALTPIILEATKFVTRMQNGGEIFLNQSPQALFGIKALAGLIPGAVLLIGALLLFLYPLKGKKLDEVQNQVLEMHIEKQSKLEQVS
jgi:GPH family glycoside/pentoside/hexuronide:cation symporter